MTRVPPVPDDAATPDVRATFDSVRKKYDGVPTPVDVTDGLLAELRRHVDDTRLVELTASSAIPDRRGVPAHP